MTTGIFGALDPTARYARIVWDGQTVDFNDPLQADVPEFDPALGGSIAETVGSREALAMRVDEVKTIITSPLRGFDAARVERWLRENALLGRQCEFYITRTLRAWWGFDDDTALDNNRGNEFRNGLWTGSALAYADVALGRGVTLPSAGILQASLVSTLPGGSGNSFFGPTEGDLVLVVKPDYAGNDGAEHLLLDCCVATATGKNRLRIVKRSDNVLAISYFDSTTQTSVLELAVTWNANTEHTLLIEWGATNAAFRAMLDGAEIVTRRYPKWRSGNGVLCGNGAKSGETQAGASGSETVMSASPDTVVLGSDPGGLGGRGSGTYGMLAVYRATFAAALPSALTTFYYPWRSYFPKGELADPKAGAVRVATRGELHLYQLRIRDGR
jgi:hypothetical protein